MPLSQQARQALAAELEQYKEQRSKPLWQGPEDEGELGGVTQSLIGRYLACKERFRINTVEGLRTKDAFNHRMEYGNMWHVCEQYHAAKKDWRPRLKEYCSQLVATYREQGPEIAKWYEVCKVQFPIYVKHWAEQEDVKARKPIFQEKVFNVPWQLRSGRVVRLKGKFDSVDCILSGTTEAPAGIYIQEDKSKGEIDREKLLRELPLDLQNNFYLIALEQYQLELGRWADYPIQGIRYNVVKRPLSRGKHSITQHKGRGKAKKGAETHEQFYARLGKLIDENRKDFFDRFKMVVTPSEREKFKRMCLEPILENLCDDYEWWTFCLAKDEDQFNYLLREEQFPDHRARHYIFPYGVYNPALEGRQGDLDSYLYDGDMRFLERVDTLFTELQ
jgi:hypothetical protein